MRVSIERQVRFWSVAVLLFAGNVSAGTSTVITVGGAKASPENTTRIPVTVELPAVVVAAQIDITLDSRSLQVEAVERGQALSDTHLLRSETSEDPENEGVTIVRIIVFPSTDAVLRDGELVVLGVVVRPGAKPGPTELRVAQVVLSDRDASIVPVDDTHHGTITIEAPSESSGDEK